MELLWKLIVLLSLVEYLTALQGLLASPQHDSVTTILLSRDETLRKSVADVTVGRWRRSGVLLRPVFTKQPGSVVFPIQPGENRREVVFSCEAQGHPPPFYRWMLNDSFILPMPGSRFSLMGGNLHITNLNKDEDVGIYQCFASNSFGTIISREASLHVAYHCLCGITFSKLYVTVIGLIRCPGLTGDPLLLSTDEDKHQS
ncbi:hypothetical protein CCH79_00010643 [Gambusia affinis]|uniref:Ig-like domain-containing protein n=1 Tax=Gambusia affinis TaxID=33528 RepID=A0A315W4S4_GAMAF|nr:hypothetical protein CCH79_00010643 [Gambusia affinis]